MANVLIYKDQGGAKETYASGSECDFQSGSTVKFLDTTALTATTKEINRACDVSARIVTWATTSLSVTEALHDGKTIMMSCATSPLAASTATLPAATGSGTRIRFRVGVVNTANYLIKVASASDIMQGSITSLQDSADTVVGWETASDSDTITLNGTTTGGVSIGDMIELEDIASGVWAVSGRTTSSGTEATPFSATVS